MHDSISLILCGFLIGSGATVGLCWLVFASGYLWLRVRHSQLWHSHKDAQRREIEKAVFGVHN